MSAFDEDTSAVDQEKDNVLFKKLRKLKMDRSKR